MFEYAALFVLATLAFFILRPIVGWAINKVTALVNGDK